jgi:hypothetical protein
LTEEQRVEEVMQLKDVMTTEVRIADPAMTLKEADVLMRAGDFGLLPVGENDRLIGTITDRDIAVRAVAEGKDPTTATVREAMSEGIDGCFRRPVGRGGGRGHEPGADSSVADRRPRQAAGRHRGARRPSHRERRARR